MKLAYRPDIDALRAIAVLAVVVFHLDRQLCPGGFVGVDVFFVISGYLITGQIYQGLAAKDFTLRGFYRRRINRLMPALLVMLAFALAAGLFLLSPFDLMRLAKSAVLSATGFSNIYLWREYGNYFYSGSAEAPLLHTWSLAVEEQFYLIWPLALIVLWRLPRRWLIPMLGVGLLLFIVVSELGVRYATSAAYFLLPSRFFEPLTGALLAVIVANLDSRRLGTALSSACGIVGLLMIVWSCATLSEATLFPGINALPSTMGTALIILGGLDPKSLSFRVLAIRPLVFIGLMSYSIYLWHWPIIAFLTYYGIKLDLTEAAGVFACTMMVGWLSWRYVERPFRRSGTRLAPKPFFIRRYATPVLVLLAVLMVSTSFKGFPQRWNQQVLAFDGIVSTKPNEVRAGCHVSTQYYQTQPKDSCVLGNRSGKVEGLLIGDSYANHFSGMIDILAAHDGITLQDYTMDGCEPIIGFSDLPQASYAEKCKSRNAFDYQLIGKTHYKYVVLAAHWPADDGGTIAKAMKESIDKVLASGAHLVIVLSNQTISDAATCPVRKIMFSSDRNCAVRDLPVIPSYLRTIRKSHPEITFIDPNSVICDKKQCSPIVSDVPLYRDDGHLNEVGSRLIGTLLLRRGVSLTQQNVS
ncbi:peptidoglycan/LPS O-acetylase OafA/YrhL [Paraburkholderia sp. GAS199]|uniref:acyltransferase family protein n=1 Tax=Paraburkholderia sp. GAS199 TaxID=3035126 RepID=UPI003D256238